MEVKNENKNENSRSRVGFFVIGIVLVAAIITVVVLVVTNIMAKKRAEEPDEGDAPEAVLSDETILSPSEEKSDDENTKGESELSWDDMSLEEKRKAYKDVLGIEVPDKELDFEELCATVNEDIYAWIYIPDTDIDYPVVQHPTDDGYYLDYNLDGTQGYPGCIYTEPTYNSKYFMDRMTVIYGHNMKDGRAFGPLHDFEDQAFFDKNRYVYIYTPDDILVYEIFASYQGTSTHIIAGHAWDDESWVQYLSDTLTYTDAGCSHLSSYEFNPYDRVLTLATCMRNEPEKRYLVQAVLLDAGQHLEEHPIMSGSDFDGPEDETFDLPVEIDVSEFLN